MHPPARLLREKLAAGHAVLGAMLVEFGGPAVMGTMADAGFDFVLLDCEHGHANPRDTEISIEAGYQSNLCTIVRPGGIERGPITRWLDAGAGGVLVPFCSTLDEVRQAVRFTKYAPWGQRGVHLLRGHTRHRPTKPADFMAEANRDLFTIIQIELAGAVSLVEEIAALQGVDALYIGPGDLSVDLGVPGQWSSPPVMDAIRRTADACRACGKIMGCHVDQVTDIPRLREQGVQMFGYFCDIGMFQAVSKRVTAEFRSLA